MRLALYALCLVAITACTRKHSDAGGGAAAGLSSALHFGERKAEQIKTILTETKVLNCASTPLYDIYACQLSRNAEQNSYANSIADISCEPEIAECKGQWEYSTRTLGSGFIATAKFLETGETWSINEKRDFKKVQP